MRMMLPTGPDGATRTYPLDGVLDLSLITLNEVIELKRATGMALSEVQAGLALLDKLIGMPNEAVLVVMSEHLELMTAYRALVWMARTRAGDRADDGSILTAEQAMDFPFAGLDIEPDPGDQLDEAEPAVEDPPTPSTDGGPVTVDGARKPSRGRSSRTSAAKS